MAPRSRDMMINLSFFSLNSACHTITLMGCKVATKNTRIFWDRPTVQEKRCFPSLSGSCSVLRIPVNGMNGYYPRGVSAIRSDSNVVVLAECTAKPLLTGSEEL